jgi:hypothetical protein
MTGEEVGSNFPANWKKLPQLGKNAHFQPISML